MPWPADIRGRPPFRRGRALRHGPALLLMGLASALAARAARADAGRLVLGTHDPALASALSVAVSPRGLSVVELPDSLGRASDVGSARREVSVQDAVAVVWLCDDDAGAHALCFCGRDGRLTVKSISVTAPLAPPDAAALALSVKMLLGPPPPPRAPQAVPVEARPSAPPPHAAPVADAEVRALPALAVELAAGARVQDATPHSNLRFGLEGVLAIDALARELGFGLGVSTGTSVARNDGLTAIDATFSLVARGQRRAGAFVLELDVGPGAHLLSSSGRQTEHRTQLSLDARAGVVWPFGRYVAGLRAGGFYVPDADTGVTAFTLPRWTGEVLLTFGLTFPATSTR